MISMRASPVHHHFVPVVRPALSCPPAGCGIKQMRMPSARQCHGVLAQFPPQGAEHQDLRRTCEIVQQNHQPPARSRIISSPRATSAFIVRSIYEYVAREEVIGTAIRNLMRRSRQLAHDSSASHPLNSLLSPVHAGVFSPRSRTPHESSFAH